MNEGAPTIQTFEPDPENEADLFGTWFARLGAIALLIGAAFGFKYAVDEGIIGPSARVLLGVFGGIALLAWGEWSQRRGWPRLAQSVSGGGIALLYLSVWSAFQLYELISGVEAFAALTSVALVGGYLALRSDSLALAALSTVGGFGNAILIGEGFDRPAALFGYIVILDCVVLGLAYARNWRALDHLAFVATWSVFSLATAINVTFGDTASATELSLAFGTVYFLMFMSVSIVRRAGARGAPAGGDLFLLVANSAIYLLSTMSLLSEGGTLAWTTAEEFRGPVILVASGVHLIAGLLLRRIDQRDTLAPVALGSSVMLAAVWVPIELAPFAVPAAWAAFGAALVHIGARTTIREARYPAYVLFALSIVYLVGLGSEPGFYSPDRVLLSPISAAFAAHIASLYAAVPVMTKLEDGRERALGRLLALIASITTLVWLSLEAVAYFSPLTNNEALQGLHFTLTGIGAVYAAGALTLGIWGRILEARYFGLAVFAATTTKLVLHDVWMLDTLQRTLVFVGLGAIFLGCSVMYHRFKELILDGKADNT